MTLKVSDQDLALPDAEEFQLAMTPDIKERIESWLHGDQAANAYERGVMCVLSRSPGKRRLTYLVHSVIPPGSGDVRLSGGVEFTSDYRRRVKREADARGGGVLYLHTHPGGKGRPSRQDVEGALRLLHNDAQHLDHENPPLAIGILTPEDNWMALGCEFPPGVSVSGGEPRYATAIRLVGESFEKLETYTGGRKIAGAAGAIGKINPETQDRQIRLWTREAQKMYAGLRVGIVGLGGGGSILTEHLARAGIGSLVLVDFDVIKDENLNRQQGASTVDASVWRPKADVAARLARRSATNPDFNLERVYGSVVEADPDFAAFRELLDCDVIMHAADGHWTTQVLDEIAHAHLIPVVSGGSGLETKEDGTLKKQSRVPITVAGPGHPCFRCTLQYSSSRAKKERHGGKMPGPDYNVGDDDSAAEENEETDGTPLTNNRNDDPAPSVISLNSIVAGMMHLRLQDLTLGITGNVAGEQRFLPANWDFQSGSNSCVEKCDRSDLVADGQNHNFPLSKDHEFERVRNEARAKFTPYW